MKTWIECYWWLGGFLILAMVVAVIVFLAIPVSAAPLKPDCPTVATFKGIDFGRCEDEDTGLIFYVNDRGWMMAEPY